MPSLTFRFTTECEVTMKGESYEDIYLQFKDFMHGERPLPAKARTQVFPPETVQLYFHTDRGRKFHEIPAFKGDFRADIGSHLKAGELRH